MSAVASPTVPPIHASYALGQYHRHAVVIGFSHFVGCGGDNRATLDFLTAGFINPALPKAGKTKRRAALQLDKVWALDVAVFHPFIKPICQYQASPLFERLPEGLLFRHGLTTGINEGVGYLLSFAQWGIKPHLNTPALWGWEWIARTF